jgi:hypothetical protein
MVSVSYVQSDEWNNVSLFFFLPQAYQKTSEAIPKFAPYSCQCIQQTQPLEQCPNTSVGFLDVIQTFISNFFLITQANINFSIWVLHFTYSSAATLILTMKADISDEECLTTACLDFFISYGIQQNCAWLSISKVGISTHMKYIHQNSDIQFLSILDVLTDCC